MITSQYQLAMLAANFSRFHPDKSPKELVDMAFTFGREVDIEIAKQLKRARAQRKRGKK